ncbi:MAG: glycine cleavage system protein H [Desulfotomaculaceae bacterium]
MSEAGYMEVNYDKFVFRVKEDYLYHQDECWVKQEENGLVTVGITDYMQKTGGDVAFVELLEADAEVNQGGEMGSMETIKTTMTLLAPVSGVIKEVNGALEDEPQQINQDPYGLGWIYKIEPADLADAKQALMDAKTYFPLMEEKIKQEMAK